MEFVAESATIAGLPPDMLNLQTAVLLIATLDSCAISVDASPTGNAAATLNVAAFNWSAGLIAQGHFVADKKGAWKNHHPRPSSENAFIQTNGFIEYEKWHLAVDERHPRNSKARYKFPFGDFHNVHRCGLLAVKARAHEYGYHDIEDAAAKLLEMIESAGPAGEKRVDQFR